MRRALIWAVFAVVFLVVPLVLFALPGTTSRVSVSSAGAQANGASWGPRISDDGRLVAFASLADNLVAGDTNGVPDPPEGLDAFVHDRHTGATQRASVASAGTEADLASQLEGLSGDGRYVVFSSNAANLILDDKNGQWRDVFVRDRIAATTKLVSRATDGKQVDDASHGGAVSDDGRYVAFTCQGDLTPDDTNGKWDVFVRNVFLGTTELVSVSSSEEQGNGHSSAPVISANGRLVAFTSAATNLAPGGSGQSRDIFLRDPQVGTTERIGVSSGLTNPGIAVACGTLGLSGDGRYVVWDGSYTPPSSSATRADASGPASQFTAVPTIWIPSPPSRRDVFLRDRVTGQTELVSVAGDGSQANGASRGASVSDDGRYVAFVSAASNLVAGDTNGEPDVFVRDRLRRTTERVSVSSEGKQGETAQPLDPLNMVGQAEISADGRYVAFAVEMSNLVSGDTNGLPDVFVHERRLGVPGDMNGDGQVTQGDTVDFCQAWRDMAAGRNWDRAADMNGDGDLTAADAALFVEAVLGG